MIFKKIITILRRDGVVFSIKRALAWSLGQSPLAYRLDFLYYKNYRLTFAPSMLTYILFARSQTRYDDTIVLEQYIKKGDTVIDVGAHIGSTAIIAADCAGISGHVLAFEPVPKFAKILQKNIQINHLENIVNVYPYAVGAEIKTIFMNDEVKDDTTNHVAESGTAVQQITLDEYTKDIATIGFLKVDVEGYEYEVLRGAEKTLEKTNVIFIEFYTKNLRSLGYNPDTVVNQLERNFTLQTQTQEHTTPFLYQQGSEYEVNLIGITKKYAQSNT